MHGQATGDSCDSLPVIFFLHSAVHPRGYMNAQTQWDVYDTWMIRRTFLDCWTGRK